MLITEGKTDRYFYSKIFDRSCNDVGLACSVRIGRELPAQAGGKNALLAFFDYLRKRRSLCSELGGKKTVVLFLLDKDLDDRCRRVRRSNHILYTEGYDFENYLFAHGDIVEAGAAASGLDLMSVRRALPDQEQWRRAVTEKWKDWVKICVFAVTRKIAVGGNYGLKTSPINNPPHGAVDTQAFDARLQLLYKASGLSEAAFQRAWNRVSRSVEDLYRTERQDEVFKGKWYASFLVVELERIAAGRDANVDGLEKRLPHHLAMTLNYEAPWTDTFRIRFNTILSECGVVP